MSETNQPESMDQPQDAMQGDHPPRENAAAPAQPAEAAGENSQDIVGVVEAILFATHSPISPQKIAAVAGLDSEGRHLVREAIEALNARYEETGAAFRVESIAGGHQMLTLPEYNNVLGRLLTTRRDSRLSPAALETLSIIAYRQPILRADIEAIRGVASGEMVRQLIDRRLVKIVGRAEVIGRPMLYGTTREFLEAFGLNSLDDLPRVEELRSAHEAPLPRQELPEASQTPAAAPAPDPAPDAPTGEAHAGDDDASAGDVNDAPAEAPGDDDR